MCLDFWILPSALYPVYFIIYLHTSCVLAAVSFNLIKGPEGTVCFVVIAHNVKGKMLQWHKFVARFHVYAKVWSKFWGVVQVTLY